MEAVKQYLLRVFIMIVVGFLAGAGAAMFPGLRFAWVALFGLLIGLSELVSRYRDDPLRALAQPAAIIYVLFNLFASVGALRLMEIFGWLQQQDPSVLKAAEKTAVIQVLVAGFGAMAFFRSSLFLTRIGNQDVQIGPITFLQVFLNAADRALDRHVANIRGNRAPGFMAGVNFEKAAVMLPAYCSALLQNFGSDDQTLLANDVAKIRSRDNIDDETKAKMLALALMNAFGESVLQSAINSLAPQIKDAVNVTVQPISVAAGSDVKAIAKAYDLAGKEIDGKVFSWSSSDRAVATVAPNGTVHGVAAGNGAITATADGTASSGSVQVT